MDHGSWINIDHSSWISDHRSLILNPESWIMNHESWIMNHESWIMNNESWIMNPKSWILNPEFWILIKINPEKELNLHRRMGIKRSLRHNEFPLNVWCKVYNVYIGWGLKVHPLMASFFTKFSKYFKVGVKNPVNHSS